MNTSRLIKILTVFAVSALVTGCKLLVVSPPGGNITSLSATRNCAGGSVCEFPITAGFRESFTAVPKPGYQFVRWEKGTGLNCGDSINPICTVALTGNAALDAAAIATFDIIHIIPIYKDVGLDFDSDGIRNELDDDDDNDGILDVDDACPLNPNTECTIDSLLVNGKEWAQPDLFRGVSWEEINAVCPEGVCAGVLRTYNLTGWTWAASTVVSELISYYRGASPSFDCSAYDRFVADGWRVWAMPGNIKGVYAWANVPRFYPNSSVIEFPGEPRTCLGEVNISTDEGYRSGWFYRTP